jgi:hypothetical protein
LLGAAFPAEARPPGSGHPEDPPSQCPAGLLRSRSCESGSMSRVSRRRSATTSRQLQKRRSESRSGRDPGAARCERAVASVAVGLRSPSIVKSFTRKHGTSRLSLDKCVPGALPFHGGPAPDVPLRELLLQAGRDERDDAQLSSDRAQRKTSSVPSAQNCARCVRRLSRRRRAEITPGSPGGTTFKYRWYD